MAKCLERLVKFVLKHRETYPDNIPDSFDISLVERNVEYMLEVDTAVTELDVSQYDKKEFRNNEYYIDLPWYEDKINSVPSDNRMTFAVLYITMQSLECNNQHKEYNEIFSQQQQREGISERIHVSLEEYGKLFGFLIE